MLLLAVLFYRTARSPAYPDHQKSMNIIARRIFFASLVYLPLLMLVMSAERF